MTKKYQMNGFDTSALAVPAQVSVAMEEIAADMRERLLALAFGAGLQVMQQLMEADVAAACGPRGPRGQHDLDRTATRHGTEAGSVTLGGRGADQTARVRATDGSGEVPVPTYQLFSSTEVLGRMALERMLAGVSTRAYPVALEPVGAQVEADGKSTSKSAVSRKFVALTETALADLLAADLTALDLVALMIDGVHFADHLCVVALGITIDGTKHPLALVEGSTENTTLVRGLLVGLWERGFDVTRPILAVLDGAKALSAAGEGGVRLPGDRPLPATQAAQRLDHLPEKMRGVVGRRIRAAYHADSALEAQAQLEALARDLDKTHPGAAGSLREGMAETLIVLSLGLPPTLARTFRSTNAIESMIGICRHHSRNVKRWRDGQMALRWCAAGMIEASHQFRPVNGHLHLPALRTSLARHVGAETVSNDCNDQDVNAA